MSLTDYKILASDYVGKDIMGLPDQVVGDAGVLKERFDALVKQVVTPKINSLIDALHPVGEIYLSADNVNPAEKFGGTWVAWGSGRVPVGVDAGQTEFDEVEKTGGVKTQSYDLEKTTTYAKFSYGGANTYFKRIDTAVASWDGDFQQAGGFSAGTNSSTRGIELGGETESKSNLQPYITCYMWKRTA